MSSEAGLLAGIVDRTLVISMPAHARRAHIERHFGEMGIDFEFFDAFDGRQMDLSALISGGSVAAVNEQSKRAFLPQHAGCDFSHIAAMLYALGQGWSRVLICEDDAAFVYTPELTRSSLEAAPRDADMLYLFSSIRPSSGVRQDLGRQPYNAFWQTAYQEGSGSTAYIASARSMSYLVRNAFPMRFELDGLTKWPSSEWCDIKLVCYLADPLLCSCAEFPSTIR